MNNPLPASPNSEMLLTSVGPTTEAVQERLLELARNMGRLATLRVLKVTDGLTPLVDDDGVPLFQRLKDRAELTVAERWTKSYLHHLLGQATIEPVRVGYLDEDQLDSKLAKASILLAPGGNPFQLARGVNSHREQISTWVNQGLPYVGESAGSIVAGLTTRYADVKPSEIRPATDEDIDSGLRLVNFDVAPHAAGRKGKLALPGGYASVANTLLRNYERDPVDIANFVAEQAKSGIHVEVLNDEQALSISNGKIERLG